jgi:hypothetical protein
MNKEFLKKLITQREKQINFLKKFNYNNHIIKSYEEDIVLANINLLAKKHKELN